MHYFLVYDFKCADKPGDLAEMQVLIPTVCILNALSDARYQYSALFLRRKTRPDGVQVANSTARTWTHEV